MSTRLDIELGASLLLDLTYKRGEEVRVVKNVAAAFIGVEHGEYLAVKLTNDPIEKFHYIFSNMGDLVVKYILKGKAYAFSSRLISKTDKPVPLLFLSYPEAVETKALRKETRSRCLPFAQIEAGGKKYRGQIYDINITGMRVDLLGHYEESIGMLKKKANASVEFQLPGFSGQRKADGVIVWSRTMGSHWSVGVSFDSLEADVRMRIEGFLNTVAKG